MFITRKTELTRPQWPFAAWPARRRGGAIVWTDALVNRGSDSAQAAAWTIAVLALGMFTVMISAGAMIAQLHVDEIAPDERSAASQNRREADIARLAALVAEHRCLLRGS